MKRCAAVYPVIDVCDVLFDPCRYIFITCQRGIDSAIALPVFEVLFGLSFCKFSYAVILIIHNSRFILNDSNELLAVIAVDREVFTEFNNRLGELFYFGTFISICLIEDDSFQKVGFAAVPELIAFTGVLHDSICKFGNTQFVCIACFRVNDFGYAVPRIGIQQVNKVEQLYFVSVIQKELAHIIVDFALGVSNDHGGLILN